MMPEGPEVYTLVDSLHSRYVGDGSQKWLCTDAAIMGGRYRDSPKQREAANWAELKASLPLRLENINCKGKFIWFTFRQESGEEEEENEGELTVWSTLGMTGGWSLRPHPFGRIALRLQPRLGNGLGVPGDTLYFYDMRNFGTFKVCASPDDLAAKLAKLGSAWLGVGGGEEDARSRLLGWDEFHAIASAAARRAPKRPLAVFLMDQGKTSGIGNYILSEVLFATRTHPWALLGDVDEARWRAVHGAASRIIWQSFAAQSLQSTTAAVGEAVDAAVGVGVDEAGASAKGVAIEHGKVHELEPEGFQLMVYGRRRTPPVPDADDASTTATWEVQRAEGPHKRTVHFVPQLQTGAAPPPSEGEEPAATAARAGAGAGAGGGGGGLAGAMAGAPPTAAWTVAELKGACRSRGLRVSGRNAELIERIQNHDDDAAGGGPEG